MLEEKRIYRGRYELPESKYNFAHFLRNGYQWLSMANVTRLVCEIERLLSRSRFGWCGCKYEERKAVFSTYFFIRYQKVKKCCSSKKKIADVYGENVLKERQCQNYIVRKILMLKIHHMLEDLTDTIKPSVDANRRKMIQLKIFRKAVSITKGDD